MFSISKPKNHRILGIRPWEKVSRLLCLNDISNIKELVQIFWIQSNFKSIIKGINLTTFTQVLIITTCTAAWLYQCCKLKLIPPCHVLLQIKNKSFSSLVNISIFRLPWSQNRFLNAVKSSTKVLIQIMLYFVSYNNKAQTHAFLFFLFPSHILSQPCIRLTSYSDSMLFSSFLSLLSPFFWRRTAVESKKISSSVRQTK